MKDSIQVSHFWRYHMKRKYLDITIIVFFCVLFLWRFMFYERNVIPQEQLPTSIDEVINESILQTKEISSLQTGETETTQNDILPLQSTSIEPEDVWSKIVKDYLSALEGMDISQLEGLSVKDYREEVRQDDWLYTIQGAYITKKKDESWDFVPDSSSKYIYDKDGNLINEYSYIAIKLKVKRVDTNSITEVYLNSICLFVYNEQGEFLDSNITETAALNKPHIGSYFKCPLEIGEELETEIVFVMQDCNLLDENYYLIKINNRGVTPFKESDISMVSVPLGRGVEDEKTDSKKTDSNRSETSFIE